MNYQEIATTILEHIGGKSNVSYATHCMTRLRLTLKDKGIIDDEFIKAMPNILGTKTIGTQYQVIIGPDVEHVYSEFCKLIGLVENKGIQELVEEDSVIQKEKLTIKKVMNNIMDAIGACVAPMLPIITAAGLLKMIVAVLGPSMLNLLPETNDFMRLLTLVGDAGFYFFPIYVAYSGAKKFGANIPIALFIAGVLLHPSLIGIVQEGEPFTVYGIPMVLTTYSTSFVPMILITWVMSYVEKLLNKYIPNSLRALLYPLLLILIMLPIALCILGPLGTLLGEGVANAIISLHGVLGPVTIGLVGALWPLLIVTGMHQALIAIGLSYIATAGCDTSILVGAIISNYPLIAIGLVYLIKAKTAESRSYGSSSLITLTLGGISEPTLFGIILRFKKSILYMLAGGFAGGFYAGLMNVAVYFVGSGNLLVALGFGGANPNSLLHGVIGCIIGFIVTFVLAMMFGFDSNVSSKKSRKGK